MSKSSASTSSKALLALDTVGDSRRRDSGERTPHWSCKAEVVIVHNGRIESFLGLKEFQFARGHKFRSGTDTEVIVHLLEEAVENYADLKSAF